MTEPRYVIVWRENPSDRYKSKPIAAYVADWSEPDTMGTPSVFQERHLNGQCSYVSTELPPNIPVYRLTWIDGDFC